MMTEKENLKGAAAQKAEPKTNKYEEALSKYNTDLDDNEVREAVKKSSPRRCMRTTTST